ncbi:MAG: S41 family peptidase [Planctomycetaceae bacterium]|nr:S41 family peptidase [Planctomycetaceae bacterium]
MISPRSMAMFMALPLIALVCVSLMWWNERTRSLQGTRERERALFSEVMALLEAHYDGPVDREQLLAGGLSGIAEAAKDRYTIVWTPEEAKQETERSEGKIVGIGVVIEWREGAYPFVRFVEPGGPAHKAGIRSGDQIAAVDGTSTKELENKTLVALVRGKLGTVVKLTIDRAGQSLEFPVTRAEVELRSVQGTRMLDGTTVGYMRIENFSLATHDQFERAFAELRQTGMTALILDLRDNRGGVLDDAVKIADGFIEKDGLPIVSTRSTDEKLERCKELGIAIDKSSAGEVYHSKDGGSVGDIPLVLLVNEASASASEVLAGALQDYGRAFLIGTKTYGKGRVQKVFPLPSSKDDQPYHLKITVARYYTPLGRGLNRSSPRDEPSGIEPDIDYPVSAAQKLAILRRFEIEKYETPANADALSLEEDRKAWATPDPHIEAALRYLRGEKIFVPALPATSGD